jgi:hypothetical protein
MFQLAEQHGLDKLMRLLLRAKPASSKREV